MLTGKSTLQIRSIIIERPVLIFVHFVTKVILNRDANLFFRVSMAKGKNLVNFKKSQKNPVPGTSSENRVFQQDHRLFDDYFGTLASPFLVELGIGVKITKIMEQESRTK